MLLTQIASNVNKISKNQIGPDELIEILDLAQKKAFQAELTGFIVRKDMTIFREIPFLLSGYTNAVSSDIGKTIKEESDTVGTLIDYDNTTRKWVVEITATDATLYEAGQLLNVDSGTGAGTVSGDEQLGYKGPYSPPDDLDPPMRKLWGVSVMTDPRIATGYGNPVDSFQDAIYNEFDKTVLFNCSPSLKADPERPYRWVYWRNCETLTSLDDDELLIIPSEYHDNFQRVAVLLANFSIYGEPYTQDMITALYKPWWNTLGVPHRIMRGVDNRAANSRQSADVII